MIERRFAVLIGNSRYPQDDALTDLSCPARDVEGLEKVLKSSQVGFNEVIVLKDLPHHMALKEINQLLKKAKKPDLVLIYFSGHGKLDPANRLHLCCVDTEIPALESTAIPVQSIKNFIDIAETRKVGLVLDCCFSGAVGGVFAKGGVDDQLQQMSGGRGVYVIAASTAIQAAMEKEGDQYSVFTKHIISGLESGGADTDGDGRITLDELYEYVNEQVLDEGSQQPMKWSVNVEGDLVLATAAGPFGRAKRTLIRQTLLELASQGVLPDQILTEAMSHLGRTQVKGPRELDKLLDDLASKSMTVGEFIGEWLAASETLEASAKAPTPPPPAPPSGSGRSARAPSTPERAAPAASKPVERKVEASRPDPVPEPSPPKPKPVRTGQTLVSFWLAQLRRPAVWIGGPMAIGGAGVGIALWLNGNPRIESVFGLEAPTVVDFEFNLPATYHGEWRLSNEEYVGGRSLASPDIGDSQSAFFELTPPIGTSSISFQYFTDTEACCDHLTVSLNGVALEPTSLTSAGTWTSQVYDVPRTAAYSVVNWTFNKDGSASNGRDRIWVDNIVFGLGGETFEGGQLPASYSGQWEVTSSDAAPGSLWSLGSPPIGDLSSAYFEMTIPTGATEVVFDFKTDTEESYDHLVVMVDGVLQVPGQLNSRTWITQSIPLRPGDALVRWEYRKDGSNAVGADRVWVDNIAFRVP